MRNQSRSHSPVQQYSYFINMSKRVGKSSNVWSASRDRRASVNSRISRRSIERVPVRRYRSFPTSGLSGGGWARRWGCRAGVYRQAQTGLSCAAKSNQVFFDGEPLVRRLRASSQNDSRARCSSGGFSTQVVGFHVNLTGGGVVQGKEFVLSGLQRFAGVGLESAIQPDRIARSRHVQAIELRFIQWVG